MRTGSSRWCRSGYLHVVRQNGGARPDTTGLCCCHSCSTVKPSLADQFIHGMENLGMAIIQLRYPLDTNLIIKPEIRQLRLAEERSHASQDRETLEFAMPT
jgi:hypothetical protein